ncbi:hypothetical protein HYH03_010235 [Edaphochlamys debaryana]|uniref:Uncharacterized protein n=1 Tax=Edaphochlamys debaryana TaxID=47281 RepID=A0A835Y5J1_9CHLO|nr:hypothetical protein HYH03_010235 [Edaphochlamys debaryana]|eukprot:KAG2491449.1 hypothetical protein HYH03_010235 [Edaphochlamys debaryana]
MHGGPGAADYPLNMANYVKLYGGYGYWSTGTLERYFAPLLAISGAGAAPPYPPPARGLGKGLRRALQTTAPDTSTKSGISTSSAVATLDEREPDELQQYELVPAAGRSRTAAAGRMLQQQKQGFPARGGSTTVYRVRSGYFLGDLSFSGTDETGNQCSGGSLSFTWSEAIGLKGDIGQLFSTVYPPYSEIEFSYSYSDFCGTNTLFWRSAGSARAPDSLALGFQAKQLVPPGGDVLSAFGTVAIDSCTTSCVSLAPRNCTRVCGK